MALTRSYSWRLGSVTVARGRLAFLAARTVTAPPGRDMANSATSPILQQRQPELQVRGVARGLALCVGASLNFITGSERRAPQWMQQTGIEWLYRLWSNPKKIGKVMTLPKFALLALRQRFFGMA